MFTRIIVPLDGTDFAEAALAPACELAWTFGAQLIITRAVPPYGFPYLAEGGHPVSGFGELDAYDKRQQILEATETADNYLHTIVARLRTAGYDADSLVELALPGSAISHAATVEHADLIVMSSHPRWKAQAQPAASATLDALVLSRVPLLAWRVADEIPKRAIPTDAAAFQTRAEAPIITPLDGTSLAESALPASVALARAFGSYIVLVHAVERDSEKAVALEYLKRIRAQIEQAGVPAQCACRVGPPLSIIEQIWREEGGSLIVMATSGRIGPHGMLFGSLTARMLELVEAPILVVRPDTSTTDESQSEVMAYARRAPHYTTAD